MKYIYFKWKISNFGDDLNGWLWPKLFGDIANNELFFLGIGTILFKDFPLIKSLPPKSKKIVFGSGYRPTDNSLLIDNTWDFRFLRGPLSSLYLENRHKYISDAAYCVRHTKEFDSIANTKKEYEISFMPYFRSIDGIDWVKICEELGFHYISPFTENGVDFTLNEIAKSKLLITEAMHGAIVADLLRVPWHRLVLSTPHTEGAMVSEFKWNDWLFSVNIFNSEKTKIECLRKTKLNPIIKGVSAGIMETEFLLTYKIKKDLLTILPRIKDFYLSDDKVLSQLDEMLNDEIHLLKKDYQ